MINYIESPVFCDVNAEAAFLGSILLDFSVYPEAVEVIPDALYFVKSEHQEIYNAIAEIRRSKDKIDLIVVRDELIRRNRLASVGGISYVVDIAESTPTAANWKYYGDIVRERYFRRSANDIALNASKSLQNPANETRDIATTAENDFSHIFESTNTKSYGLLHEVFAEMEKGGGIKRYVSTGFQTHDNFYLGFGDGHVIIVAGRPQMGKTSCLLSMAYNIVDKHKTPVAYFSLEMPKNEIATRIMSQVLKVSSIDIYKKWLPEDRVSAMESAKKVFSQHKFVLDETRGLTTDILRSKIYFYQRKFGIKIAFVDYLQLLNTKEKAKDLYTKACLLSHEIKSIAMSLEIPIVVGSQLNRGVEGRPDKRPKMSDLRDSGKIEEDADMILMLYRPSYYDALQNSNEIANTVSQYTQTETAEIIVEKNRQCGKTGIINMKFYKDYGLFEDIK